MKQDDLMHSAIEYARYGMAVFPLVLRGKKPDTPNGFKDATTDIDNIKQWWRKDPNYNIGIATGKASNGIFVIDLDVDKDRGIDGIEELKQWEWENSKLPDACQSITGRGGVHMFYKSDKQIFSRTGLLQGIDIRDGGGYIIALLQYTKAS